MFFEVAALLVVAVERRGIARSRGAGGLGREAELAQELAHEPGLVDHAHHAEAAAAFGTREDVHAEGAAEQGGPVDARGRGEERAGV